MHEVGIMQSTLEIVLEHARSVQARQVKSITLTNGAMSGVESDSLRFAFDVVTRGTIAEGALLTIETVSARARCEPCTLDFDVASEFIFVCPQCKGLSAHLLRGRELLLKRIELN
jgi:hydrogenase nickel incorporation protein HypA/HybF